jgi:hypothetical protein
MVAISPLKVQFAVKGYDPAMAHIRRPNASLNDAMPEDNPLVIGGPYALPVWSAVTLKFIEARDDCALNRQLGAKTESARKSPHLTGLT